MIRIIHYSFDYLYHTTPSLDIFVFGGRLVEYKMSSADDSSTNRSTTEILSEGPSGTTTADSVISQSPSSDSAAAAEQFKSCTSALLRPVGYPSPVTQLFEYILKAWDYQKGDNCSYKYIPSKETHLEMTANVMVRLPGRPPILVKDSKFRSSRVLAQNAVAQLALEKLSEEDPELKLALEQAAKELEERAAMPPPPPPPARGYNPYRSRGYHYNPAGFYYPPQGYAEVDMGGIPADGGMYYPMDMQSYYPRAPPPPPLMSAGSSTSDFGAYEHQQDMSMHAGYNGGYGPVVTPTGHPYAWGGQYMQPNPYFQPAGPYGMPMPPHGYSDPSIN
jgi:hypothetical protein